MLTSNAGWKSWPPKSPIPNTPMTLVEGIHSMTTAGDAGAQAGMGAHVYLATASMKDAYLVNADAEMLFVPQPGALRFVTRSRAA